MKYLVYLVATPIVMLWFITFLVVTAASCVWSGIVRSYESGVEGGKDLHNYLMDA